MKTISTFGVVVLVMFMLAMAGIASPSVENFSEIESIELSCAKEMFAKQHDELIQSISKEEYVRGWNECFDRFGRSGRPVSVEMFRNIDYFDVLKNGSAPVDILFQNFGLDERAKQSLIRGFEDCKKMLRESSEKHGLSRVRQAVSNRQKSENERVN